jgi:hypothetical protein
MAMIIAISAIVIAVMLGLSRLVTARLTANPSTWPTVLGILFSMPLYWTLDTVAEKFKVMSDSLPFAACQRQDASAMQYLTLASYIFLAIGCTETAKLCLTLFILTPPEPRFQTIINSSHETHHHYYNSSTAQSTAARDNGYRSTDQYYDPRQSPPGPVDSKLCSACGAPSSQRAAFCTNCGARYEQQEHRPLPDDRVSTIGGGVDGQPPSAPPTWASCQ